MAALRDEPIADASPSTAVLALAKRPEEKRLALAGLAALPSADALDLLVKNSDDKAVGTDAVQAALRLAAEIGPVSTKRTETALKQLKDRILGDADLEKKVDAALKALANTGQSPDGYILAWMLSGPYTGGELFDAAFPPEKAGAKAEWRPCAVPANKPLIELDKILGGNNCVAYLRTGITSPKAQDALLELGSDDGIKVWLNGKQVHANNVTRPCSPGADKVKIQLKQGANPLLLKVTQGGGEWSAIARLRSADNQPLDVSIGLNE